MKASENTGKKRSGKLVRRLLSLLTIMVFILSSGGFALSDDSPSIAQYTAYPPFGGTIVKPNVLINLDTSTSLNYFAYNFNYNAWAAPTVTGGGVPRPADPAPSEGYSSNTTYYGYFDSNKYYTYDTTLTEFQETGDKSTGIKGLSEWDGNFLNWLTMRRSDLMKKALVGGKTKLRAGMVTASDTHAHDLIGEPPYTNTVYVGYQKKISNAEAIAYTKYTGTADPVLFTFDNDEGLRLGGKRRWSSDLSDIPAFSIGDTYTDTATNNFKVIVHHALEDGEPEGVIQRVGSSVRWGLEFIDDGQWQANSPDNMGTTGDMGMHDAKDEAGGYRRRGKDEGKTMQTEITDVDGGTVMVPVGYDKVDAMVLKIATMVPYTPSTPLAESLWTATGYYRQESATGNSVGRYYSTSYPVGDDVDPFNYALNPDTDTPKPVYCSDSFVITITDGEPTRDRNVPTTSTGGPVGVNTTYADDDTNPVPDWQTGDYFWDDTILKGSHYIDDVALWSHVDPNSSYRDLRSQPELPEAQYISHYFIYANFGSGTPDARRLLNWPDSNNTQIYTGNAEAGGAARNGGFIETGSNYLPEATGEYDSNPADVSNDNFFEAKTGDELEAALLKALFKIIEDTASGTSPAFAGSRNGLGNMVYQAYFYPGKTSSEGKRSWLGYLQALEVDSEGNVSDTPLWEAGERLWERDISTLPRLIYTSTTGSNLIEFKDGNGLDDYLRAADSTEAGNIIKYIEGVDIPGYRPRTINGNVWKLGDIIYSSPTPVGFPDENFDRLYRDFSYTTFYRTYKNRRNVVYVGANDGMLHAFNGGKYNTATGRYENGGIYPPIGKELALGDELWAFIPKQLLPHLKWLTEPNYTHVYYVDLKPKVTDVRIFCDAANSSTDCINGQPNVTHPGGWGTILIGGMRLGGKQISAEINGTNETFYPAYFALDITNPEALPKLLWTFTDMDSNADGVPDLGLGLTMSYPAVARVETDAKDLWVMIAGSGPTDFDAGSNISSDQPGKAFVVDLKTGSLLKSFDTGVNNAFMTDPITVDVNLDYKVDMAYIGEAYDPGTGYNQLSGNMYRLVTKNSTDVFNEWKLSTLIVPSGYKPVTSAPSSALDDKGNMWVFFGTGKFIGSEDKISNDAQAFYGVKETCKPWKDYTCSTAVSETNLLDVSGITVDIGATDITATGTTISGSTCGDTTAIEWCDLLNAIDAKDGWVINFPSVPGHESLNGERSFIKPVVLGGLVIFTSYIPEEDLCSDSQGNGYLWAVYYETGSAYKNYVFTDEIAGEPATVGREKQLGEGFASVSAMVTRGGSLKALAQTSLGNIPEIEIKTPFSLQSGIVGFKTGVCQEQAEP